MTNEQLAKAIIAESQEAQWSADMPRTVLVDRLKLAQRRASTLVTAIQSLEDNQTSSEDSDWLESCQTWEQNYQDNIDGLVIGFDAAYLAHLISLHNQLQAWLVARSS